MLDPVGPFAEDTDRDLLTDIRSNWLTSATSAQPKSGAVSARPRKPRPLVEVDYLAAGKAGVRSIGQSARETFSSLVGMVSDGLRERAKGGLVLGLLAAVMIFGALVYEVVVNFILDPATVPAVTQADPSQGAPAAQSPIEAYLPPVSAAGSAASSGADSQSAAERAGSVVGESAILGLNQVSTFDGANAAHIANGTGISGHNDQRAGLADDDAVTLTQAADTMAQKGRDAQGAGVRSATQPAHPVQTPIEAADANVAGVERTPSGPRNAGGDSVANSAGGSAYLDLVRAGQRALENNDIQGAYKLAAQAKALNPGNPAALDLMQVLVAASGDPGDAQAAALESIAHGGKAVFELQTLGAGPTNLHPARIVITATTLQFIPEAAYKTGAFSIPLASIASVQMGGNVSDQPGLSLLIIRYNDAKSGKGELSLTDVSESSAAGRSQSSPAQQAAFLGAIRNVILTTRSRSRLVR